MSDSIEKIHKTQLEILEAFKSICKKHGLRYYAIGGTLIGVHRHKGFIPWDDDIDLGMPRPDFDKFVALQKEYPKGYTLTLQYHSHTVPVEISRNIHLLRF